MRDDRISLNWCKSSEFDVVVVDYCYQGFVLLLVIENVLDLIALILIRIVCHFFVEIDYIH